MPGAKYIEESPEFQKTLRDPKSPEYKAAAAVIADHTVREAIDILGLTEDATPFARYEIGWAFGLMDSTPGLVDTLTTALRAAFDNGLAINFNWVNQPHRCTLLVSLETDGLTILLGTPRLDEAKLPELFSGGYSSSLKLLSV